MDMFDVDSLGKLLIPPRNQDALPIKINSGLAHCGSATSSSWLLSCLFSWVLGLGSWPALSDPRIERCKTGTSAKPQARLASLGA